MVNEVEPVTDVEALIAKLDTLRSYCNQDEWKADEGTVGTVDTEKLQGIADCSWEFNDIPANDHARYIAVLHNAYSLLREWILTNV